MTTGKLAGRIAVTFFLALTCAACGPYLKNVEVSRLAFRSSERCTQGPLLVHFKASGARWGEQFSVAIVGPRAVQGQATLAVDGKRKTQSRFRSYHTWKQTHPSRVRSQQDLEANNTRCLQRPEPVVAGQDAPSTGGAAAPPTVAHRETVVAPPPPAPAARPRPEAPVGPAHLVLLPGRSDDRGVGHHRADVISYTWTSNDPDATHGPFRKGEDITVRIWSSEPNDLKGASIVAIHQIFQPSDEKKWIAKLRQDERHQQQAWKEAEAKARERDNYCFAHHDSEDCWGKGGYAGRVKHQREAQERAWKRAREAAKHPKSKKVVRVARRPVAGPPPAAKAETPPPRPTPHAEWINGYWHWSGTAWVWFGGWWRVPRRDRRPPAVVTATAGCGCPATGACGAACMWMCTWSCRCRCLGGPRGGRRVDDGEPVGVRASGARWAGRRVQAGPRQAVAGQHLTVG